MTEIGKWNLSEGAGFFFLSSKPGCFARVSEYGDLGHGSARVEMRFSSAMERQHFIEIDLMHEELGRLRRELAELKTVRGANRNLREVRAACREKRAKTVTKCGQRGTNV